jgi:rod shape determining protein RodA
MAATVRQSMSQADQRRGPRFDWLLLLSTVILVGVGLMSLYSEGMARDGGSTFKKQVLFTLIGLVPFSIFAFTHPKFWARFAPILYGANVLALLAVLKLGSAKKGAERWIEIGPLQFQPSEMAKLLTIITLATFFANRQNSIKSFSTFALSGVHVAVPMLMILMQPHLGACMVIFVSWLAVCLIAGVPMRYLGGTIAVFILVAASVLYFPPVSRLILRDYQQGRVAGMFSNDSQGKNWQTDRAEIAFGVGGVMGSGFMKGEQKKAHFIPEQHNDFIFTVVGEEGGLIGATLVLLAFGFFFYRVWIVMFTASDLYYRMIAAGIFAALFFHMFVNIAMVLKIVPVVGLWLPFLSYGGTALWLCLACVGLLLSIRRREKPVLFS